MNILQQLAINADRGPSYCDDAPHPMPSDKLVRLIAYYLPQYHPIDENDAWWGRGFTEWTNVSKALPRYVGQYQPRLPGELGFYDLRVPEILVRQAELARRYGIEGFCFHHYWFNGKTLLDAPIRMLLAHPEIDLPFCVNWANESWSRRWQEGRDHEILISQDHNESDDLVFAASLLPFFRDPRYIRVDGRPLLMVYRPKLFPDMRATLVRWRNFFREEGIGNPYLVMAHAFGGDDPRTFGFDATAGFPPHESGFNAPQIQDTLELLDPAFTGRVVRYADMVSHSLAHRPTSYIHHQGVCPSWDNEARKPGHSFSVHGGTPEDYGAWLSTASRIALDCAEPAKRIVFINAWNEWGEGAHLEPDRHFGYAYLVETSRALAMLDTNMPLPELPPLALPPRLTLHRLIMKNLAYHAANAADGLGRALRRQV